MRLDDFMKENGLDDAEMARRIGKCTEHAVKKWRYGERTPRPSMMQRICSATGLKVTPNDFLHASEAA